MGAESDGWDWFSQSMHPFAVLQLLRFKACMQDCQGSYLGNAGLELYQPSQLSPISWLGASAAVGPMPQVSMRV